MLTQSNTQNVTYSGKYVSKFSLSSSEARLYRLEKKIKGANHILMQSYSSYSTLSEKESVCLHRIAVS